MPRDPSGDYTLAAGNPVAPGTIISTTWANPTMDDLAVAMTDSLSRTGNGNMSVAFKAIDGLVGAPGLTFINETTLGFFRFSAGLMDFVVDSASAVRFSAANQLEVFRDAVFKKVADESQIADAVITTEGDVIIGNNLGAAVRLGIGTTAFVLTSDGTTLGWAAIPGLPANVVLSDATAALTAGYTQAVTDLGVNGTATPTLATNNRFKWSVTGAAILAAPVGAGDATIFVTGTGGTIDVTAYEHIIGTYDNTKNSLVTVWGETGNNFISFGTPIA